MRKFFTKKRIIWGIILIVLGLLVFWFSRPDDTSNILTETALKKDLKQTVLATGQVVSNIDLDLNFKSSGPVQRINIRVGDKVNTGQVLASLDQKDELAALTSARGSLAAAQANYQKVLEGASSEEVAVAQVALDNAIRQHTLIVENARSTLLNSTLEALPDDDNTTVTISIFGTYTGDIEGEYLIDLYTSAGGISYRVTGLGQQTGLVERGLNLPIGQGLYINFGATGTISANTNLTISIPNTLAADYLTNYNAYNTAVKNKEAAIATAQANLNLAKAQARPADIQAAQAQVLQAQGQVQSAQAALDNTIIRAPVAGTITAVNIKIGEQTSLAGTTAIVLQDVGNLYLEANVSEANVASIKPGQEVTVTFDALGPDQIYKALVEFVDPASTVISGVVNYKVTSSIESVGEVKPGMTANLSILTATKPDTLAVSQRSVVSRDGKKYIRIITDPETKTFREAEVSTGLEADGGLVEITSGLEENTEIISFIQ